MKLRIVISAALFLTLLLGSSLPAPADVNACSPEPPVARVLDAVGGVSTILELSPEPWRERLEQVEAALEEHPKNLFLHRRRQDFYRYAPKDLEDEVLARAQSEYARLHEDHPEDPRFAYLLGRIAEDQEVERRAFTAAVEADPDFPWGHFGMIVLGLRSANQEGLSEEEKRAQKEQASEHLARFLELCPDRPYLGLFYSRSVGDAELWEPRLPGIRDRLREGVSREAGTTEETLKAFPLLWGLEFRLADPAEHGAVRERIAEDVAALEALGSDREQILEVLQEGYGLAGMGEKAAELEKKLHARSPCSREAVHATMEEWGERASKLMASAHDTPDEDLRAERERFEQVTREWVERCPDEYLFWLARLRALHQLEDSDPDEVVAAGERATALYGEFRGYSSPTGFEQVASVFLDQGLRLERVLELVDRADAETDSRMEDWNLEDLPEAQRSQLERSLAFDALHRGLLRARALAGLGEVESARELFGELRGRLDELAPAEGAAGREELFYRGFESALWRARAELAEAEERPADAAAYWLRAASAKPEGAPPWVQGPGRDEARERAAELWAGLGGTEEGLAALGESAAAAGGPADEATLAEYSPWKASDGELPPFELADLSGTVWTSEELEGKTLFVNAWATWCGPCREELPVIQELHERLRDREDVLVVTLNMDDNPGVVAPYLDEEGFTFPALLATEYLREELGVIAIPRSWILGPGLDRRFLQEGYDASMDHEEWLAEVEGLIRRAREGSGS